MTAEQRLHALATRLRNNAAALRDTGWPFQVRDKLVMEQHRVADELDTLPYDGVLEAMDRQVEFDSLLEHHRATEREVLRLRKILNRITSCVTKGTR